MNNTTGVAVVLPSVLNETTNRGDVILHADDNWLHEGIGDLRQETYEAEALPTLEVTSKKSLLVSRKLQSACPRSSPAGKRYQGANRHGAAIGQTRGFRADADRATFSFREAVRGNPGHPALGFGSPWTAFPVWRVRLCSRRP